MKRYLFALAGVALLLLSYVSSGTLDIDEGFSVWLASHSTLSSLWQALKTGDSSDLQMGLYYVYLWAWTHVFGTSEYALRAANLPWALLFAAAVGFTLLAGLSPAGRVGLSLPLSLLCASMWTKRARIRR